MPVYIVTGKLGSGKTLSMVGRMRDYARAGKPVATNIDLDVRALLDSPPRAPIYRLPDRPGIDALEALGSVHDTAREELNGCLVLDECGTWLNSRTWGDKGRAAVIDWLLHSRKLGWDVFLIVQNITLLDKQIRDSMAEYVVTCRRLDRIQIPLVGRFLSFITAGMVKGLMPQVHLALVRYGIGPGSIHAQTWTYRGRDLYAAYQSVQVIHAGEGERGMHALTWYMTAPELAEVQRRKPKPKLPWVARVQRLPEARRIPALRTLGLL